MQNLWHAAQAQKCTTDLDWRVYTSQLLGQNPNLVMHGGGNTSVKSNLNGQDLLYVKGSGWDLETIEPAGFAPVKMQALLDMATLTELSDLDMVAQQREAMIDPKAPNPSVEAILHALIPFKYVDHTHADALVTLSNTPDGLALLQTIYGKRVIFIPYVMPGFILAKAVYEQTKNIDWSQVEGMVLMHHGLFTFSDDPKEAYQNMIELAGLAETYLHTQAPIKYQKANQTVSQDYLNALALAVGAVKNPNAPQTVLAHLNQSDLAQTYAQLPTLQLQNTSVLTPDHIIRTKQKPMILSGDINKINSELADYIEHYHQYFNRHQTTQTCLNPAPNYAIIQGVGSVAFATSNKEAQIIEDINNHTFEAILRAQSLGGYVSLSEADLFEMEYWSLEQAKLKKA